MPRHRPVDYPQVHPPSRPYRFSWQDGNGSGTMINMPVQSTTLENRQERGQSRMPPLPILPDHLGGAQPYQNQQTRGEDAVSSSQRRDLSLAHAAAQAETHTIAKQERDLAQIQYHQTQTRPQYQTQTSDLRSDVPRYPQQHQEVHTEPQLQKAPVQSPTPTYEDSQAAYRHSEIPRTTHTLQTTYHTSAAQAVPAHQSRPEQLTKPDLPPQDSSEFKPARHNANDARNFMTIHLGPDENPLSPASPTSPTTGTTNIRTLPPVGAIDYSFAQATAPPSSQGGTWQHGLFSCADPSTCFSSLFCPCVVYGKTQYRLGLKSSRKDPTNMLGYSAINGSCVAWTLLCGVNVLFTAIQRTRVRKTYEMESQAGNVAGDCARSLCCCCCVIAQDEREMKLREDVGRSNQARSDVSGYQRPGEMRFAAPPQ